MMKNKNITTIISVVSVLIMIVWGTLAHSYRYSWIAVFTGGILIASIGMVNKCGGLNYKSLPAIIPMWSVLVMFIWAFIEGNYSHAWLAVVAGGIISFCISLYNKGKADPEKTDEAKDGDTVDVTIEPKVVKEPEAGDGEKTGE